MINMIIMHGVYRCITANTEIVILS